MSELVRPSSGLDSLLNRLDDLQNTQRKDDYNPDYDPDEPPGAPTNVTLKFRLRETRAGELMYVGVGDCDVVAPGVCEADINYYIARLRATDSAGTPVEGERIRRDLYLVSNPDDLTAENLKFFFNDIDHPKKWYWQLSIAIVNKANLKGAWSEWTDPLLPHAAANPTPPVPQNIVVTFDKNEKDRTEPRWRMLVTCTEKSHWDIKPHTPTDAVTHSLQGAHNSTTDTLNFASIADFPVPVDKERVSVRIGQGENREIVTYNDVDAVGSPKKLLGVKRGQDGTDKRAWNDGDDVTFTHADAVDRENDLIGYEFRIRRCNDDGDWILDDDGKFIQRHQFKSWEKEDDDADGLVRVTFPNVRYRHKWKVSARTIARGHIKGDWSDWVPSGASYASPSDTTPPPAISGMLFDVDRRNTVIDITDYVAADPDDPDQIDPDYAYFQYQLATDAGFTNIVRKDMYCAQTKKKFHYKKPGSGTLHGRARGVDASGNKTAWYTSSMAHRKPGKVRNLTLESDTRGIYYKFDPPNAWSDATTTDWDESEVAYYIVRPYQSAVLQTDKIKQTRSTKGRIKTGKNSSGWTVKVEAVGHVDTSDGESTASGSAADEPITVGVGEIEDGAVDYDAIASSMPAMAPPGSYAITTSGSPPRSRLSTGPSGYKTGDMVMNTGDGNRMYKKEADGVWWRAVDGPDITAASLIADKIATGTLSAVVTMSGTLYVGTSTDGIVLKGTTDYDKIKFQVGGVDQARISGTTDLLKLTSRGVIELHSGSIAGGSYSGTDEIQLWAAGEITLLPGRGSGAALVDIQGGAYASGDFQLMGYLNHDGSRVGFYGTTPVTQRTIVRLTNSTGGTANDTVAAVDATYNQGQLNNNFADLTSKLNSVIDKLGEIGLFSVT